MDPHNLLSEIHIVGFDLDQTLYPKSPLVDEKIQEYLYQKIAKRRVVSLDEAEQLFKERYRGGAGMTGGQTLRDLGLADGSEIVQEALERADIASMLVSDETVNRLLGVLRERYEGVDLITSSNREQTEKKLSALGIALETFSSIITSDDSSKSTGDSYRLWLSLYPHLEPKQFLYIGDRVKSDHEIPSALGIKTALVYVQTPDPALLCPQYASLTVLLSLLTK